MISRPEIDTDLALLEGRQIGIRAIDYQHAYFLDLYNDLILQVRGANGAQISLSPFISEVFSYTDYHFKTEETLMQAVGYPELAAHRQEHRAFFNRFDDLTGRLDEHQAVLGELTAMIRGWILGHIDTHDRHFGDYYAMVKAGRGGGTVSRL